MYFYIVYQDHQKWVVSGITRKITNFRKKVEDIIVENWEKGSKKLKTFQKLLQQISESPQYNQSRQSRSSRGFVYEETDKEQDISGNTVTKPK